MPKKPKLTPEEKKALKIAKKEAKKREAENKRRQIEYDHLEREIKYGQLTIQRHEKNWRQMLLNISLPRMRSELEYAWHMFERVVDAKDFTISLLMDEIGEAEEQYMRNMRSHMENIEVLIELCYDQMQELQKKSKQVIYNLYNSANFERTDIAAINKGNEEYLRTMLFILANAKKESEKLIRGEYLSKQEVEISKLNDICHKFTEVLETKFEGLWKDACTYIKAHINEYATRRQEYDTLSAQDNLMQKLIKRLWVSIYDNLEVIRLMRSKQADFHALQCWKINQLTNERSHFEGVYNVMKQCLESELTLDDDNLMLLTLESNATIKHLEDWERKGEKLLKLSAICRKYETLEEKTMSFPVFEEDVQLSEGDSGSDLFSSAYRKDMTSFFNRVAQAEALRYRMNEECEYLMIENKKLKQKIHQYCQCLNCQ